MCKHTRFSLKSCGHKGCSSEHENYHCDSKIVNSARCFIMSRISTEFLLIEDYHVYYACYIMSKIFSQILLLKTDDKLKLHQCNHVKLKPCIRKILHSKASKHLPSGFILPRILVNSKHVLRIFAQDVPPKMSILYVVENWSRDLHRKMMETCLVFIRILKRSHLNENWRYRFVFVGPFFVRSVFAMSYDISIRPEDLSCVSSGSTNFPQSLGQKFLKRMTQVDNEGRSEKGNSRQFLLLLIFFQTVFIILFGFFVKYDENWNDDELTRNRLKLHCQFNDAWIWR